MLKKVLALLLTLTLVLSMGVSAFAAPGDVTGSGDTTYVDTDILEVVLPTDSNWDFVLDPQGLIGAYKAGLFSAGTAGVTAAQLAPYVGKIIAGDYAPVAVNLSSYKMTLGVDIKIGGDAITVATSGVLEADDKNNVLLTALLSDDSVTDPVATFAVTNPVAIPLSAADQTLGFVLNAPQYVYNTTDGIDFTYDLAVGDDGYGTQIQLGGLVNTKADWSAFRTGGTKSVTVTSKFNLTKSTEEELALPVDGNAYGYVGFLTRGTPVAFSTLTANGNATTTTTELTLTFDEDPTTLADTDITVTGADLVSMGGSGTTRTLTIENITVLDGEDVTVAIANPAGFTITPSSKTVAVNVAPVVRLLSGASGTNELTSLSAVGATTTFRIDGLTGRQVADLESITAGGVALTKTTHYTVSATGGVLQVTFTATAGWFTAAKTGPDTIVITVNGTAYTFDVVMA